MTNGLRIDLKMIPANCKRKSTKGAGLLRYDVLHWVQMETGQPTCCSTKSQITNSNHTDTDRQTDRETPTHPPT